MTSRLDLKDFEKLVRVKFIELHNLYHFSSRVRNSQKKIDDLVDFSKKYKEKSTNGGFTNEKEKKDYQEQFESIKEKAKVAEKELIKAKEKINSNPSSQKTVFEKVVGTKKSNVEKVNIGKDNEKTKYITDDITKLSRKDRKLVSRIFGVVDTILTPDLSSLLKDKIKEELSN